MNDATDRALVLFDGVCNLCNASVNFVIDRDPRGHFAFAALQGETTQALRDRYDIPTELDTICLIEDGKVYLRSGAALRIARRLNGAWPLLAIFLVVPAPIRDLVYRFIARNRYRWFGQSDQCRLPTPELEMRLLP